MGRCLQMRYRICSAPFHKAVLAALVVSALLLVVVVVVVAALVVSALLLALSLFCVVLDRLQLL